MTFKQIALSVTNKIVLVVCAVASFCGCGGCGRQETYTTPDFERLVQDRLTNDVTGYSRTINIEVDNFPTNREAEELATATATVEFVNILGGVERTNLPYEILEFTNTDGKQKVFATLDYRVLADRDAQAYADRMKELGVTNRN